MFSREFSSVDIAAPVEQVFAYVTDLERHPEWSNNDMDMKVEGEPVSAGTTFETAVKAFGKETTRGKVVSSGRRPWSLMSAIRAPAATGAGP